LKDLCQPSRLKKGVCGHNEQAIDGTPRIKEGYNPATWMLEVSTPAAEIRIGQDFADIYRNSDLYQ
jgi:hypothetical protein